jgi:hypothetical protein
VEPARCRFAKPFSSNTSVSQITRHQTGLKRPQNLQLRRRRSDPLPRHREPNLPPIQAVGRIDLLLASIPINQR